jgi:hypothetical protein
MKKNGKSRLQFALTEHALSNARRVNARRAMLYSLYMQARICGCAPETAIMHARIAGQTGVNVSHLARIHPGPKPKYSKSIRDENRWRALDAEYSRIHDC